MYVLVRYPFAFFTGKHLHRIQGFLSHLLSGFFSPQIALGICFLGCFSVAVEPPGIGLSFDGAVKFKGSAEI